MKDYKNWDNIAVAILETGIQPEGRTIRACRAFCLRNGHKYPGTRTIRENERLIRRMDEKFSTKGHQMKDTELEIATSKIRENPNNPRSEIGSVEDLKSSIQKNGFFGTILVRPLDNGMFEVIAGSRRFRACQELGMKTVRCEVRKCDDTTAYQIATAENIVRENMNAVDEANAVANLFAQGKSRLEIAAIFGKTPRWAEGRRKIVELGDKAMKALAAGKINLGHAEVLTMCPKEDVEKWLGMAQWRSPEELKYAIMNEKPLLEKAPFNAKNVCKNCENRSDCQRDLFGDVQNSYCLNRECFEKNVKKAVETIRKQLTANGYREVPESDYNAAMYGWSGYCQVDDEDEDNQKTIEELKAKGAKPMFWIDEDTAEYGVVYKDDSSNSDDGNDDEDDNEPNGTDNSWRSTMNGMDWDRRSKIKEIASKEEKRILEDKLKGVFGMMAPATKAFILAALDRCYTDDNGEEMSYLKDHARASADFLDEVAATLTEGYEGLDIEIREYLEMDSREDFERRANDELGEDWKPEDESTETETAEQEN